MSERRWFGVGVRPFGLGFLAWSLEWVIGPVYRLLLGPTAGRAYGSDAWRSDAIAAGWKIAVGLALLRGAGHVVRFAYPSGSAECGGCGYDIRATPSRCPECGLVPPTPAFPIEASASSADQPPSA